DLEAGGVAAADAHRQAEPVEVHRYGAEVADAHLRRPLAIGLDLQLMQAALGRKDPLRRPPGAGGQDQDGKQQQERTESAHGGFGYGGEWSQPSIAVRVTRNKAQEQTKKPAITRGFLHSMVAGEGIEPPTRGFSIPCSTN